MLFVCMGNICRSPTAEGIMRSLLAERGLEDRVHIESAGLGAWHVGERADRRTRAAAEARGILLDRRARQFSIADFSRFDYVLAMDHEVYESLHALARTDDERRRIFHFREFDPGSPEGAGVPDPYYGGPEGFQEVFDICEAGCRGLLDHLRAALDEADVGADRRD
jgi:protein-tyrosine phosphatase